jgi:hypothetical protein
MSRHYLANDINRLLVYKVNRSIARDERARIHQKQLENIGAQLKRNTKQLQKIVEQHQDNPKLQQLVAKLEGETTRLQNDLRLSPDGRLKRFATLAENGLRLAREVTNTPAPVLPPLPQPVQTRAGKQQQRFNTVKWITAILVGLFVFSHFSSQHTTPHQAKAEASATPAVQLSQAERDANW